MAAFERDPMTLTRFIMNSQQRFAGASGDLTILITAIATACKAVSSACRRAGLMHLYGLEGSTNSTGERRAGVLSLRQSTPPPLDATNSDSLAQATT